METGDLVGLAGVPVVIGLVQVLKLWVTDERVWPLLALGLGVALQVGVWAAGGTEPGRAVLVGLVTGLAASGLYSQARTVGGS